MASLRRLVDNLAEKRKLNAGIKKGRYGTLKSLFKQKEKEKQVNIIFENNCFIPI